MFSCILDSETGSWSCIGNRICNYRETQVPWSLSSHCVCCYVPVYYWHTCKMPLHNMAEDWSWVVHIDSCRCGWSLSC